MDKKTVETLASCADQYMAYETDQVMTWCGGCGNYGIQNALKRALVLEKIKPRDTLMCFDVGCNGNGSDKIDCYTIHGLHGRVLPLAAGAKIANPKLTVIASAGDGATFSEGVSHLVHAIRSDYPVVFLHHDNQNYALTTGQASSTTPVGCHKTATPDGVVTENLNPLAMVLGLSPSFVAQTFSADVDHMTKIFQEALHHKGFSFVQILQSCPTYNRETSDAWYSEHVFDVEKEKHDVEDIWAARKIVENPKKLPLGILYRNPQKKNFLDSVLHRDHLKTTLTEEVRHTDISKFLEKISGTTTNSIIPKNTKDSPPMRFHSLLSFPGNFLQSGTWEGWKITRDQEKTYDCDLVCRFNFLSFKYSPLRSDFFFSHGS
ncbi:2-oxoacid ferredoxin oxidoreductase [Candidatus Gracilibacteria bacterium]|nr:2-oxoacid ferredoxin oxidoreductase [Candidatus Gracilibacteria bacterium]